jgi:hypothetical protein
MANEEHLARLKEGVEAWNQWRAANPGIRPDLSEAQRARENLRGANLSGAHLDEAELTHADLSQAELRGANLWAARLIGAHLHGADLFGANLSDANLHQANRFKANLHRASLFKANLHRAKLHQANLFGVSLFGADLLGANLSGANLSRADLTAVRLVETDLNGANLAGCRVYGISAWDVHLTGAQQSDLIITPADEPVITVDNLQVAQFIYLLLHNEKIREVIDTITSKAVLILGRFTPKKAVLDVIREELRRRNYLPIVFDFEKPASRDLTETISILAHIARFIIADLTAARSIPQELQRIVSELPSVPVQPLLQASAKEYSMFEHFKRFPWVLPLYRYKSTKAIIASLKQEIITPVELKAKELLGPVRQ